MINFPVCLAKAYDYFFPATSTSTNKLRLSKSLENTTLCLIKPHVLLDGTCGDILLEITNGGFVIKGMKMYNLRRQNCEEFYEVYNGVSSDYLVRVKEHSFHEQFLQIGFNVLSFFLICYAANGDRIIQWTVHCIRNWLSQSQ